MINDEEHRELNILLDLMKHWIKTVIIDHNSPHVEDAMNEMHSREALKEYFIKCLK